jgi:DUF4097 and DUF4098 domain-containing protein YvlB
MTETVRPTRPVPTTGAPGPATRWNRPIQVATAIVAGSTVVFGTLCVISYALVRTDHETRTFTAPVRQVEVRSDTGDLRVTTRPAGTDVIVRSRVRSAFSDPEHSAAISDGVLTVTGSCPGAVFFDTCSVDFDLAVPAGTVVVARTSTGDVRVQGATAAVTAKTNTGDVEVDRVSGPAELTTDTGDVRGKHLRAASVRADSDTGDVDLLFESAPTTVRATTDTGDVKVRVPADGSRYRVDSDVDTGDEKITVPVDSSSARSVFARSSTGDVQLRTE